MKTIIVTIWLLTNPHIDFNQEMLLAKRAIWRMERQLGIKINARYKSGDDQCTFFGNHYSTAMEKHYCFQHHRAYQDRRHRNLFLVKPWDGLFFGGVAEVCRSKGVGYATVGHYRKDGSTALGYSRLAIMHELGHLLGAMHHRTGLMHRNVLRKHSKGFNMSHFSIRSRRQIGRCLRAE